MARLPPHLLCEVIHILSLLPAPMGRSVGIQLGGLSDETHHDTIYVVSFGLMNKSIPFMCNFNKNHYLCNEAECFMAKSVESFDVSLVSGSIGEGIRARNSSACICR